LEESSEEITIDSGSVTSEKEIRRHKKQYKTLLIFLGESERMEDNHTFMIVFNGYH
jgi:hypothetical protein